RLADARCSERIRCLRARGRKNPLLMRAAESYARGSVQDSEPLTKSGTRHPPSPGSDLGEHDHLSPLHQSYSDGFTDPSETDTDSPSPWRLPASPQPSVCPPPSFVPARVCSSVCQSCL